MSNPEGTSYYKSMDEKNLDLIRKGLLEIKKQFPDFKLSCEFENTKEETLYTIKSLIEIIKRLKYACKTYEEANKKLEETTFKLIEKISETNKILLEKFKGD